MSQIQYNKILEGRCVIIGGSSGIGFAIAQKFIDVGAKVLFIGRNTQKLVDATNKINSSNLFYLQRNVEDISACNEKLRKAIEILGGLDIFIKNVALLTNVSYENVT